VVNAASIGAITKPVVTSSEPVSAAIDVWIAQVPRKRYSGTNKRESAKMRSRKRAPRYAASVYRKAVHPPPNAIASSRMPREKPRMAALPARRKSPPRSTAAVSRSGATGQSMKRGRSEK
jgi:hypothetical protein